jgi:hypothetical protein
MSTVLISMVTSAVVTSLILWALSIRLEKVNKKMEAEFREKYRVNKERDSKLQKELEESLQNLMYDLSKDDTTLQ